VRTFWVRVIAGLGRDLAFRLMYLLRPGNAGSNTFTDHEEVLAAAIR
jgi:hypothetical protein